MMNQEDLWQVWSTLPPVAQQEVVDFMTFLHQKHQSLPLAGMMPTYLQTDWLEDDFVGMWQDQPEMNYSTAWVRQLRLREWE